MKNEKSDVLSLPVVPRRASQGSAYFFEKWLLQRLYRAVGSPSVCVQLWDGTTVGKPDSPHRMLVHERAALWRLMSEPNLHFGDDYSSGAIEVEGLKEFLQAVHESRGNALSTSLLRSKLIGLLGKAAPNTLSGSRENIHHHYDIGNDFYRLWLDEEMVYTCAYYPKASAALEQAQLAKMDHVCRKLKLKPGEQVVEAGCGWGGLSRYMARRYGVKVRAFNISKEQLTEARERARADGLEGQIEYIEEDYRNISGKYDVFVSVGMLEHVGVEHYGELGRVIDRCLVKEGRGLIHTIGRNRAAPMNPWVQKRIFPGAYPPTLREMMKIFEPWEFSVTDVENLRLHYAKTLEAWLERFEHHAERVEEMFDERFVRAWRLYLASSAVSFTTGYLQLFQVVFSRAQNNDLPRTRSYLYA